jgi:hypothetical protein
MPASSLVGDEFAFESVEYSAQHKRTRIERCEPGLFQRCEELIPTGGDDRADFIGVQKSVQRLLDSGRIVAAKSAEFTIYRIGSFSRRPSCGITRASAP